MDKEFIFSTEIKDEWKENIEKLGLNQALEYLKDSQDKILFAILDINSFYYVLDKKKEAYQEWNEKLFANKTISGGPINKIEYCNQHVPAEILLNKISMNFFTSLHSFFDNYAHFIHSCLFPNDDIPKRLYFGTIFSKISKINEFKNIYDNILEFKEEKYFDYIVNVDNVNKHRGIISPQSTIWLNDGTIDIEMPKFDKDGTLYSEEQMMNALEDSLNLVNNFYKAITKSVFEYLEDVK